MRLYRKLFFAALAAAWASTAPAQELPAKGLAGNLTVYPYVDAEPPAQTPTPDGYEPFHMEHYGRHGSRWLIGKNDYLTPVRNLEKAERAGKLTPLGQTTLTALRSIADASHGRLGELSDKGALQHQIIGRRMARNYPQIFNDSATVDAKATIVIRCILSMFNGLEGIQQVAPGIRPTTDASEADMRFMNYNDRPAWPIKDRAEAEYVRPYQAAHRGDSTYLSRLVTDPEFARDSVAPGIMPYLYWVLGAAQGHTGQPWLLEEVFSPEELMEMWKSGNATWFIHSANTPMTNHRMPYTQRKLLERMIERTDSALATGTHGANLRYGHDGILVNLVTLMELNNYGREFATVEELDDLTWRDFEIIPMAGNMQMVFYRPEGKAAPYSPADVLVKVLLNEREVTLPVVPVVGPYYRWSDLRDYYLTKLQNFSSTFTE
ncbi:MAG: histidine-type phosphatase [Bacteroidales bacterium]|nr:histidine-type phosphatase [Bacteroidales bacterium]